MPVVIAPPLAPTLGPNATLTDIEVGDEGQPLYPCTISLRLVSAMLGVVGTGGSANIHPRVIRPKTNSTGFWSAALQPGLYIMTNPWRKSRRFTVPGTGTYVASALT